jgi:hypothetical protein
VVQLPRHEQAAAKEVRAVVAASIGKESTALRANAREMVVRRSILQVLNAVAQNKRLRSDECSRANRKR